MKKTGYIRGRLIKALKEAVMPSALITIIGCYAVALVKVLLYGETDTDILDAVTFILITQVFYLVGITIYNLKQEPHKYDNEIIGENFVGVSKRNNLFSRSLELLLNDVPNQALAGFKLIEDKYSDTFNGCEKSLVYFYIARCYEEMCFFPNALGYYEKAKDAGFAHDIINLMYARSLGNNGDTKRALAEYNRILSNPDGEYASYVRTDIGRMYLKQNDAENALVWFNEAIERHENYATALGEAAIAYTMLHKFDKGEELHRAALLNNIHDTKGYVSYYKKIQAAALSEAHTKECAQNNE